jgi:GDP-L-fucose synthase
MIVRVNLPSNGVIQNLKFGGQLQIQSYRKEINAMNELFGKNILVTGASGFIGTNLIESLTKLGANVTGVIYRRPPQIENPKVKYIKADLQLNEDCELVCKNIDYVFMCAANSSGAAVMSSAPLTHLTPNVIMNTQMLAAAYKEKVNKFIFVSSNTVYPLTDFAVTEDDVTYDFYGKYHIVGWMKLFSEKMCEMYSWHINNPMRTIVIRPGNLYGPYDKFNRAESKVIAALIRRFSEKENPMVVWGDGSDIKDFLYIDDFIDGMIKATINEKLTGPLNIASGQPVTIRNVVDILKKITENTTEIKFDITKPTMIPIRLISIAKVRNLLDWSPKTSLDEGLDLTYKWYTHYYKDRSPEDIQ